MNGSNNREIFILINGKTTNLQQIHKNYCIHLHPKQSLPIYTDTPKALTHLLKMRGEKAPNCCLRIRIHEVVWQQYFSKARWQKRYVVTQPLTATIIGAWSKQDAKYILDHDAFEEFSAYLEQ